MRVELAQVNMWTYHLPTEEFPRGRVQGPLIYGIPTNGVVNNGKLVMGAGVAAQALMLLPSLDKTLGELVHRQGNIPFLVPTPNPNVYFLSFPTKHHFRDNSDLRLIKCSAEWSMNLLKDPEFRSVTVLLPAPGCGLGNLNFNTVREALEPILDDRFILLSPHERKRH